MIFHITVCMYKIDYFTIITLSDSVLTYLGANGIYSPNKVKCLHILIVNHDEHLAILYNIGLFLFTCQ